MKRLICFFFLLSIVITSNAQYDLKTVIPLDASVRTGKLPNGMVYYVRRNARPENRAEFRLAVNAGSTAENDDQQGLAHVVEHMAFNGTKNFKKSEIVDYLESVGTKFGAHLNAYTSFDETVYMLQLPTDKPEIVEKGLLILRDWSHELSFDSIEVEKERGVVVEEWRLGQGANERLRRQYWPVLFQGSRYESRLPIGKKEVIQGCPQKVLRDFYHDWYRPDLMAVIAVGDFDPIEMEKKIIAGFSSVPSVKQPRPLQVWPVPDNAELAITTCTDKEAQYAEVEIIYKQPVSEQVTVGDYRTDMARALFSGMFSARLAELQRAADPPFLYGGGQYGDLVRNKDAYTSFAMSREDGIERALTTLVTENERVRRFGFTATELQRQKADMMSNVEKLFNEREMTESRGLATECVSNFLRQEPMPGITYEYELYKRYLDGITLDEVNAFAGQWITEGKNCVVLITAPEKPTLRMPTKDRIREIITGAKETDLIPYVDQVIDKPLVDEADLKPGKIVKESEIKELGVKEWKLSNGVRIMFKKTDFKDEVVMNSYSWGGWSLYDEKDFLSAAACDDIIDQSGIGPYDATTLEKALSGKIVRCSPFVSDLSQGINGSCAPKDLETLFQLTFDYFTAPRKDTAAFRSYMVKTVASLRNRGSDPQSVFMDTMTFAMAGYDSRYQPRTPQMMESIDHDRAMAIYRDRFSDANGFTFCFVGSIDENRLRSYSEKYLASLPSSGRVGAYKDMGIRSPKGRFERVVLKGTEPKSSVVMRFNLPFEYNRKNRNEVSALAKLLNIRLREVLREEMSGVYGVSCSPGIKHYPVSSLEFVISFSCAPENVEPLSKAALNVIEELKTKGCEEKNLVKIKETAIRERQTSMKENQFWISSITTNDQNGEDLRELLKYEEWVNAMTTSDMLAFAKKYLDTSNYARFILNPEK